MWPILLTRRLTATLLPLHQTNFCCSTTFHKLPTLLLAVSMTTSSSSGAPATNDSSQQQQQRERNGGGGNLPLSLDQLKPQLFALPVHYQYKLEPSIKEKIVAGEGYIKFRVVKPLDIGDPNLNLDCYLNNNHLTKITSASVDGSLVDFLEVEALNKRNYKENIVKYLFPRDKLHLIDKVGNEFDLKLEFTSRIRDDLEGQYLARTKDNQELLVTQFESHFARRAFPCLDEPDNKATFEFQFVVDQHLDVLHNTSVVSSESLENGKKLVSFERTLPLPTYLIAYCIGQFERVSKTIKNVGSKSNEDILVSCVAPKNYLDPVKPTLEHACICLEELMRHFGEFPLKKIDHVALPDFSAGAMENMGLITYRDSILQINPGVSSLRREMYCILVICHELAHTWFGNLVTMKWWNDLWLNESFANCVEFLVCQKAYERLGLHHKYDFIQMFIDVDKRSGMDLDSRENSHPISVKVEAPDEIESLFDAISYQKGSAILNQLQELMHFDEFFAAVRQYIKTFKFQNAEAADLWRSMEQQQQQVNSSAKRTKSIPELMDFWIQNKGFPCVKFELLDDLRLKISQHQFKMVRTDSDCSVDSKIWPIPMSLDFCFNGSGEQVQNNSFIFDEKERIVELPARLEKINFNKNAQGFFVYEVDEKLLQLLPNSFANLFNDLEKIEFIANLKFLMQSTVVSASSKAPTQTYGDFSILQVLRIIKSLKIRTEDYSARIALNSLFNTFLKISKICRSSNEQFAKKVREMILEILDEFEEPSLSLISHKTYSQVTAELGAFNLHIRLDYQRNPKLLDDLMNLYEARMQQEIDDSFLFSVFYVRAKQFSKELLEIDDNQIRSEKFFAEMEKILRESTSRNRGPSINGFGSGLDARLTRLFMEFGFSKRSKLQDLIYFSRSLENDEQSEEYLRFLMDNCSELMERIPLSSRMRVLDDLKAYTSTSKELRAVESLNEKVPGFCNSRVLQEICDYIRSNINKALIFSHQL